MIGVVDSGVGGLAVYRLLKARLPQHAFLYVADQSFAPYGYRSQTEIIERMRTMQSFFVAHGAVMTVIACNTATVSAIDALRIEFSQNEIIGIEPAVKPAAQAHRGVVVLGTDSTVNNARYRALVKQWQQQAVIYNIGLTELVRQVESGDLISMRLLEEQLAVALARGVTAVVVGCTHFSFLVPAMQRRWPHLAFFDGAAGVAEQVVSRVQSLGIPEDTEPDTFYSTAGVREVWLLDDPTRFEPLDLTAVAAPGVNQVEYTA